MDSIVEPGRWTRAVAIIAMCATALLASPGTAYSQGGPPLVTDDPFTPRPWHWEINTALASERGPDGHESEMPAFDLNYGWGSRIELKLEVPYRWVSADGHEYEGWGNPLAGVKVRFADRLHGWALSMYPQVEIPLSAARAAALGGDSAWAFLLPLEAAHSRGRLELAAEAGYWLGHPEVREAMYGLVLGWIASDKLELLSECNGHGDRPLDPRELVCGLGARRDVTEHVGIMGSFEPVVAGNDPARPRYHLYLGVQTHVRGGGFWRGARRALIGK